MKIDSLISLDFWTIASMVLVLILLFWGFRILKSRMDEQRYREELAELEFEQSLLSQVSQLEKDEPQYLEGKSDPKPIKTDFPTSVRNYDRSSVYTDSDARESNSGQLFDRLSKGGIIKNTEGYLELHGDPKGVKIVKLRNGQTALLVPHMESEAFLRKNIQRTDFIIMSASDGNAYVIRRVEDLIADLV